MAAHRVTGTEPAGQPAAQPDAPTAAQPAVAPVVALVVSAAGGALQVRSGFVVPATARGWTVAVSLTPTAATWFDARETAHLERLTGLPVRVAPRVPGEARPHPTPDCVVVAPASASTVAKLALGIGDSQALTKTVEAIGRRDTAVVVFPRANAAYARHPAWAGHLATLRAAGVHLVDEDVWPRCEPDAEPPDRPLPWAHIIDVVDAALRTG